MADANQFTTTRWTLVLAAAQRHDPKGSEAFARLCERYYSPLYGYLRRRGHSLEDAQDLLQGFIAHVLESDVIRHADPARGRFRAFLLTSLKHYAINVHIRAIADKRGGGAPTLSLDFEATEHRYRHEPRDNETPERLYDRRWALAVLEQSLRHLRSELRAAGRDAFFDAARTHLTGEGDVSYRELGGRFGMSENATKVAVHRLRRRYRDLLRTEIADTVETEHEVDDELHYLMSALRA